ncbi:Glyoxalase/Bleomycin resistance protein/Dioxygenase superfamily protein [Thermomonospora echinospora]|uniref:Glyoxalase/Bleomycin resistance protein/Dioxygenase superfamily protein n=1 Tax=Thermomonospora echinospora TaxID=1992 RepID=A0A1H6E5I8_9ACTN|nr:VOC family protein [Thermomonospora echinospora]SEG92952.1 Glyoxalase/Bleomycin resistance protein/Dioxygenase superfamily protein [Thermomonospora echinospora]
MSIPRIYHVGIVVAALEPAMEEFSEATGVTWGRVQRFPAEFATPSGPRTFHQTFVLSLEGPPYIELLVRVDDSVWEKTGLHHLGMWSEDVAGESAALEGRGCAWEAAILDGEGRRAGGCYHTLPNSDARIELVSRAASAPRLERYLAGGDYR